MGDSSWKTLLKSQHADLEKLEAMDAQLNDVKIAADIENALRKTRISSSFAPNPSNRRSQHFDRDHADDDDEDDDEENYRSRPSPPVPTSRQSSSNSTLRKDTGFSSSSMSKLNTGNDSNNRYAPSSARGPSSRDADDGFRSSAGGGIDSPGEDNQKTPDATARYQKARLKLLTKQVEDGLELRKQLNESVNDLQRQLTNEREENKKAKKRIQLLEVESKRSSNKKVIEADNNNTANTVESLSNEISEMKRQIVTAERIAKQSEVIAKAKETHLKRALETVSKLKTQVNDLQLNTHGESVNEKAKTEMLENRVKLLERQRADLTSAFKKQMKLIDVLKRQKVHIEAARLLAFTEEEFVRTLDWGA